MTILLTGGAGYIGSHTCVALIESGYEVIIFDNLSNSSKESLASIERIVNKSITFIHGDICSKENLEDVFKKYTIEAVIHFAGLKAVGESVICPLKYYQNNLYGTMVLCDVMANHGCKSIVFSSSATVYGASYNEPIKESFPLSPESPYGRTKLFIENFLNDIYYADNTWKIVILRYFNPVGAHSSGTLGENPQGIPNNLMPYIGQVAVGNRKELSIFGNDYDTHDGTGMRDYIHVMDLALGHCAALEKLPSFSNVMTINLGTGTCYSVLDVVKTFEKASGCTIPYNIVQRRTGDIAKSFADPSLAKKILGWQTKKSLLQICEDSWQWQKKYPHGYTRVIHK